MFNIIFCLNQPLVYLPYLKPIFHRLNDGINVSVYYPQLLVQDGHCDCGLFALGYACAIAMNINPSSITFNQNSMREEFNKIVLYH